MELIEKRKSFQLFWSFWKKKFFLKDKLQSGELQIWKMKNILKEKLQKIFFSGDTLGDLIDWKNFISERAVLEVVPAAPT